MYVFDIQLEGANQSVTQWLFDVDSKDISCYEGHGKQRIDGEDQYCDTAQIYVKSLRAKITGGPEFKKHLLACNKDPKEIKALAWEHISRCITRDALFKLMEAARLSGIEEGRSAVQESIKSALGLE